ncbi:MAG: tyrosine-type recombinase/integrase [Planctomycetota bacterium]|jgi:integrase
MSKKIGLYKDKKLGRWRVRWYGRYDPKTGRERRYSKTFDRKVDAIEFRKKIENEFGLGLERDPSNETLKDYAEQWLKQKAQNERIRPATVLLYEGTLERLYDYFGPDRLVRKIDRNDAKNFLASLKPKSDRDKPLSDWTKHRVLRHCKTLFSEIVKDGKISNNPFADIKIRRGTPSDWYYLKPGEFVSLLDVTPTLKEKVLYALAYTAGLRESEALALYWANIDFNKGLVHIVNRPATEKFPPFYVKDTDARIIPLPKLTLDLLTQLYSEAMENIPFVLMDKQGCQRIRDKWQKCKERGREWLNRYWMNNVIKKFHRREKRAEIKTEGKKLTVHILRKCCIQNWANSVPMNVVKELAGHSSIETTNLFYSTVDEHHLKAAAAVGDNLLNGKLTDHKMTISTDLEEKQKV